MHCITYHHITHIFLIAGTSYWAKSVAFAAGWELITKEIIEKIHPLRISLLEVNVIRIIHRRDRRITMQRKLCTGNIFAKKI